MALAGAAQRRHRLGAGRQRAEQLRCDLVALALVAGHRDHAQRAARVVERDHGRREQEARRRGRIALAALRQRHRGLEAAHRVVGHVAHRAAAEGGHVRQVEVGVRRERGAQRREQVASRRGVQRQRAAAGGHERVAPDLLAALHGLQQEAGPALADAQERADGREQVGGQLAHRGAAPRARARPGGGRGCGHRDAHSGAKEKPPGYGGFRGTGCMRLGRSAAGAPRIGPPPAGRRGDGGGAMGARAGHGASLSALRAAVKQRCRDRRAASRCRRWSRTGTRSASPRPRCGWPCAASAPRRSAWRPWRASRRRARRAS